MKCSGGEWETAPLKGVNVGHHTCIQLLTRTCLADGVIPSCTTITA